MGSFASTCCVSGLAIEAGDPVYWFLLDENRFRKGDGGFNCEIHGRWVPRTWPIKAEYNDYGSIENWETGPFLDVIMQGFQQDLVEVGTGDNRVHDVPVKKDMGFEQLLNAVWEGRVRVNERAREEAEDQAWVEFLSKESPLRVKPAIPEWMPTLENVENLVATRLPDAAKGLIFDEFFPGCIRIRWGRYDGKDDEMLSAVRPVLENVFSIARTAGYGRYASHDQLLAFMSPGKTEQGYSRSFQAPEPEPNLLVQQAMIRVDVWNALLKVPVTVDWGQRTLNIEEYFNGCRKFLAERVERRRTNDLTAFERFVSRNPPPEQKGAWVFKCELQLGLGDHVPLLLDQQELDLDDLVRRAAEFAYVQNVLDQARFVWRPSDTAGPQFAKTALHLAYFEALTGVAKAIDEKSKREQAGREAENKEDED